MKRAALRELGAAPTLDRCARRQRSPRLDRGGRRADGAARPRHPWRPRSSSQRITPFSVVLLTSGPAGSRIPGEPTLRVDLLAGHDAELAGHMTPRWQTGSKAERDRPVDLLELLRRRLPAGHPALHERRHPGRNRSFRGRVRRRPCPLRSVTVGPAEGRPTFARAGLQAPRRTTGPVPAPRARGVGRTACSGAPRRGRRTRVGARLTATAAASATAVLAELRRSASSRSSCRMFSTIA